VINLAVGWRWDQVGISNRFIRRRGPLALSPLFQLPAGLATPDVLVPPNPPGWSDEWMQEARTDRRTARASLIPVEE